MRKRPRFIASRSASINGDYFRTPSVFALGEYANSPFHIRAAAVEAGRYRVTIGNHGIFIDPLPLQPDRGGSVPRQRLKRVKGRFSFPFAHRIPLRRSEASLFSSPRARARAYERISASSIVVDENETSRWRMGTASLVVTLRSLVSASRTKARRCIHAAFESKLESIDGSRRSRIDSGHERGKG